MSDLSTSERRLIVALDRLDYTVEQAGRDLTRLRARPATRVAPMAAAPPAPSLQAENRQLSDDVVALHDRQAATLEAMRERLEETLERLAGAGEHMARLAAANDGLSAANRDLIAAADGKAPAGDAARDTVRAALEAEIESLRAARAAEIAQMGEILDALDRMLGTPAPAPRKPLVGKPASAADHGSDAFAGDVPDAVAAARDTTATFLPAGLPVSPPQAVAEAGTDLPAGDTDAGAGAQDDPDLAADLDLDLDGGAPAERELTVEREDLPEDELSLFGGVYDDEDDGEGTDPEDTEGDRR